MFATIAPFSNNQTSVTPTLETHFSFTCRTLHLIFTCLRFITSLCLTNLNLLSIFSGLQCITIPLIRLFASHMMLTATCLRRSSTGIFSPSTWEMRSGSSSPLLYTPKTLPLLNLMALEELSTSTNLK